MSELLGVLKPLAEMAIKKRKIIHTSAIHTMVDGLSSEVVYATCDDGMVLRLSVNKYGTPGEWRELPPIPQKSEDKSPSYPGIDFTVGADLDDYARANRVRPRKPGELDIEYRLAIKDELKSRG
jgi:hypothetical protein